MTTQPTDADLGLILIDLGSAEVTKRIAGLSAYEKYDTLATTDATMTPGLMAKWAAFAAELGKVTGRTVIIGDYGNIQADKSYEDKAHAVARAEFYRRAREAEETANGAQVA